MSATADIATLANLAGWRVEQRQSGALAQPDVPVWTPLPGPQTLAYECQADELFFGGAAGGGKTDVLIGLASTAHWRSIIFRREFPQLRDIIERTRDLLGPQAKYNHQEHIWRWPNGRLLEFGAVQYESTVSGFQGRAHDLKSFDELPQLTERQYRFLIGWNRTTRPGQRTRVVGAGNPPTDSDGEWVIVRWGPWLDGQHPHPAEPGELRWYAIIEGKDTPVEDGRPFEYKGETIQPKSRTFIPARVQDNPYLMAQGYVATLQAMPEPLRSQMLYGDFGVGLGSDPWQIIPTEWVRLAQQRWETQPQPDLPMTALGVDVARGGADQTVIAPRYGHWYAPIQTYPGSQTPDGHVVAALIAQAVTGDPVVNLDVVGIGASPYDALPEGIRKHGVNFGAGSDVKDKTGRFGFSNLRAESWWRMREALDPLSGDHIALPPDPELRADLCAPRWRPVARGIQVESKEDVIKRIGRSPDKGDAVVLAYIFAPAPAMFASRASPMDSYRTPRGRLVRAGRSMR